MESQRAPEPEAGKGLLRFFRGRQRSRVGPEAQERPSSRYGVVEIGISEEDVIKREKININQELVWIGDVHDHIKGEIASNVKGIIAATHGSINFSIVPPRNETPSEEPQPSTRIPQKIGSLPQSVREERHKLSQDKSTSRKNIGAVSVPLETLNANLKRLGVNQLESAKKLIDDAFKIREKEKKHLKFLEKMDEELKLKMPSYDPQKLEIRSVHGEIALIVLDPEVLVVIPDKYSHRGKPPEIKGQPPKDPKRTIEAYTIQGSISIEYPESVS